MKKSSISVLLAVICLLGIIFIYPASVSAGQKPQDIIVSCKKLTLYAGESETLQIISIKPENASDKVIWKSKDKKIVMVTAKGKVLAKKAGKTEIIAVSKQSAKVRKSIKVTVKKKPKQEEKEISVNGGIYDIDNYGSSFRSAFQNSVPEIYRSGNKNYKIIRTKQDYKRLIAGLKKNGCTDTKNTFLAPYGNTKFKNNCLLFIDCKLNYPVNQKVIGFQTKFDKSGRLYGEISVQYEDIREPGISYPAVLKDNVIVLRMDKKDAGMIDYFKIQRMPYQK